MILVRSVMRCFLFPFLRIVSSSCTASTPGYQADAILFLLVTALNKMEVFLMVKRKNLSMFLDGKVTTTIYEVKQMIQGITKKAPEDQRLLLFKENRELEDNKRLDYYGLTSQTAKAQSPALLAVTYKNEDGQYEEVDFTPLSQPPDPPEVMKQQESSIIS